MEKTWETFEGIKWTFKKFHHEVIWTDQSHSTESSKWNWILYEKRKINFNNDIDFFRN